MGQHKLINISVRAKMHGKTTHKPRIGQFNKGRSNMVHVSAQIVDNPLKAKALDAYQTMKAQAEAHMAAGEYDAASLAERHAAFAKSQYDNAPDRIVGKRKTFAIGANQAKQYRKIIKATAKRDRRANKRYNAAHPLVYKGSSPTGRTQSHQNDIQELPRT